MGGAAARVLIDARPLQGADALRGIGTYARGLLAGLVAEGFDREVALLVDAGLPPPALPAGSFEVHTTRRRYHGRVAVFEDAFALGADLDRVAPRLFHSLRLTLPNRAPCPVAITLHDLIPWALGGPVMAGERFRHWPGRRLLPRAELVIAPSEATAADARRLGGVRPDRIRVVPEGVDPLFTRRPDAGSLVAERWDLRRPFLLFVGALDFRKDPRGLLRAWEVARQAGADVDLVLAGDPGPQAPAGLPGTRALGRVTDSELAELLSAARCLVFPSRYEGFGLPVLEAMACGCPVVAYRNSSIPELVGEAAVLVEDGMADLMGRAVAGLLADPAAAGRLSVAGRARARRYTWRRAAAATIAAYRSLGRA